MSYFEFPNAEQLPKHLSKDAVCKTVYLDKPLFQANQHIEQGLLGDCFIVAALNHILTRNPGYLRAIVQPINASFAKVCLGKFNIYIPTRYPFLEDGTTALGISPSVFPGAALIEKAYIIYLNRAYSCKLHYDSIDQGGLLEDVFSAIIPSNLKWSITYKQEEEEETKEKWTAHFTFVKENNLDSDEEWHVVTM